jgi:hypothetical protein
MAEIKSGLTAQHVVFWRLIQANVISSTSLTGGIFKARRPKDSKLEDIVVRTLAINGDQVQEGLVNVNVHVPNLQLTDDSTQPDEDRFTAITNIVLAALNDYRGFDFWFTIKVPGLLYPDGNNWFSNIQVEYTTLQKEN